MTFLFIFLFWLILPPQIIFGVTRHAKNILQYKYDGLLTFLATNFLRNLKPLFLVRIEHSIAATSVAWSPAIIISQAPFSSFVWSNLFVKIHFDHDQNCVAASASWYDGFKLTYQFDYCKITQLWRIVIAWKVGWKSSWEIAFWFFIEKLFLMMIMMMRGGAWTWIGVRWIIM